MKIRINRLLTLTLASAALFGAAAAQAELSANIGMTSNYMWRGMTQTDDQSAVFGGVDYAHDTGLYAGIWTANVTWTTPDGFEVDYYGGYAGEARGIGFDLGYVRYTYPHADSSSNYDFGEFYLGAEYSMFGAKLSYDSENANKYIEANLELPLVEEFNLGVHVGYYDFDQGTDFSDYELSLGKGDFRFALSNTSEVVNPTDSYRASVSWSTTF